MFDMRHAFAELFYTLSLINRCQNMKPQSTFIPFNYKERERKKIRKRAEDTECKLLFRA